MSADPLRARLAELVQRWRAYAGPTEAPSYDSVWVMCADQLDDLLRTNATRHVAPFADLPESRRRDAALKRWSSS